MKTLNVKSYNFIISVQFIHHNDNLHNKKLQQGDKLAFQLDVKSQEASGPGSEGPLDSVPFFVNT
jgi:hypothetical protein